MHNAAHHMTMKLRNIARYFKSSSMHLGVREVEAVELPDELLAIALADAQQAADQLPHHRRHGSVASDPLKQWASGAQCAESGPSPIEECQQQALHIVSMQVLLSQRIGKLQHILSLLLIAP
jgi:hypothetical protein